MHKLIVCCLLIAAVCAAPALARLEKLGRESLLDVENLISSILKGKTQELWKEYIQMKNQSKTTLQFIKANGTDIALELFRIFGAEGEDLTSVLTAILQDPLAKLRTSLFVSKSKRNMPY
nr:unnamed protein product [Spirometra erinaceieuropaei]